MCVSVCLAASKPTCSDRLLNFNALQSLTWACFFFCCFVLSLTHMSVKGNEEIKALIVVLHDDNNTCDCIVEVFGQCSLDYENNCV